MWNVSAGARFKSGFSLVELAIVLVILGLLVGGILGGKALIRASELRSVSTQHQQITTAIAAFKDKYFAFPGDMPNATQFWGAQHAVQNTCWATASTSALTCNGNGDKILDSYFFPGGERERFWQHLANAGLIEGQYSGVNRSYPTAANALPSKIANGFWLMDYYGGYQTGGFSYFNGYYENVLTLGTASGGMTEKPIMTPSEVWGIDVKLDDGKPATGKMYVFAESGVDRCTDTASDAVLTANYLLSSDSKECAIGFRDIK